MHVINSNMTSVHLIKKNEALQACLKVQRMSGLKHRVFC